MPLPLLLICSKSAKMAEAMSGNGKFKMAKFKYQSVNSNYPLAIIRLPLSICRYQFEIYGSPLNPILRFSVHFLRTTSTKSLTSGRAGSSQEELPPSSAAGAVNSPIST